MNCLETQSKIMAFIEGRMNDEEKLQFVDHIRSCASCAEELEIYYTMLEGIRKLDRDEIWTTDMKTEMNNRLNQEYRRAQGRRKLTGTTLIILSAAVITILIIGIKSYQETTYLASQALIKSQQSEDYIADHYFQSFLRTEEMDALSVEELMQEEKTEVVQQEALTKHQRLMQYLESEEHHEQTPSD